MTTEYSQEGRKIQISRQFFSAKTQQKRDLSDLVGVTIFSQRKKKERGGKKELRRQNLIGVVQQILSSLL